MSGLVRHCAIIALTLVLVSCGTTRDLLQGPSAPSQPAAPQPAPVAHTPEASPQQRARLHTELAAGYYQRGQMDVALQELDEAVKLDPDNGRAYNVYGLVYAMLGEDAKAQESFQRALALAPQDSEIHQNWGWFLCTRGKARESLPEFEAAVRNPLYRTPEIALVNAGRCAASLGDDKAAESYYRRALSAAPNDANAAFGLAQLAYKGAHLDEARSWLRRAVTGPNPPAQALYLGMCIERRAGDRQSELSYASQLRNRYPEAPETKAIATGKCE